jgi:hypothetical protein
MISSPLSQFFFSDLISPLTQQQKMMIGQDTSNSIEPVYHRKVLTEERSKIQLIFKTMHYVILAPKNKGPGCKSETVNLMHEHIN